MQKKRVVILGPFSEMGGRELMTSFIAKTLQEEYDVDIFSLTHVTQDSRIFFSKFRGQAIILDKLIYESHFFLRLVSFLYCGF